MGYHAPNLSMNKLIIGMTEAQLGVGATARFCSVPWAEQIGREIR